MTFKNISELSLGSIVQIIFSNGVRNQLSVDYRDFDQIKKFKVGSSLARELRYMFQSSLGAAATQYANPGQTDRAYPRGQQASVNEYTARFKELNTTIELEQSLWYRASKSPQKYAEPLGIELDSKSAVQKRRIAADWHLDGTGVIGTMAAGAAAVTSPTSNRLVFTISATNSARGHVGCFEDGDILRIREADGTASALLTPLATEPVYWQVYSKDRSANTVTMTGLDADFAAVATIASVDVNVGAGEVFYRLSATIPDLSSISDYGTASESLVGIESLAAADGRVVNGITMSGSNAGSRLSSGAGANPVDVRYIQSLLSQAKTSVGEGEYKYKLMSMSPECMDALLESGEPDRRFSLDENTRGSKNFNFIHRNDKLECSTSEYCHPQRIWFIPESRSGSKVFEFHGSDFTPVAGNGMQSWNLKPSSSGGHTNVMVQYLQAVAAIICKHPKAVACLDNFTV
jgi:hypothetical protein